MRILHQIALGLIALTWLIPGAAQITFYENDAFRGHVLSTKKPLENLADQGFNDQASSVFVEDGRWEICDDANFRGHCTILSAGGYDSLSSMGMNDRISSTRPITNQAGRVNPLIRSAQASPDHSYGRRPREALFQAQVTSSRAIAGTPARRCWTDRPATQDRRDRREPKQDIAGDVVGRILGHQAGGRQDRQADPGMQACEASMSREPAYWAVTYDFKGVGHRLQMSTAPGATITVNRRGEPRQ